jgi:two-component system OmpR family sensor kinase
MSSEEGKTSTSKLITGLGVFFLGIILAETLHVVYLSNPLGMVWIAGLATSFPFTLGLVYMGARLPTSFFPASRSKRIELWCLGGLSVFLLINIVIMTTMPPDNVLEWVSWGRWAATLGAGVGLLVGGFECRSIEQAVQTERQRVRAQEAKTREDLLSYLNATLRHEVLNTANVIHGQADLALAEYDEDKNIPDRIKTIKSRSQQMEAVIEDVRLLLQASRDQLETGRSDVVNLLCEALDMVQDTYPTVAIETSLPERAMVKANKPLRRAFANLFENAVEHNDNDIPRIEVTVRQEIDTVVIQVADNGPGISEAKRGTLFQQEIRNDANHGLGLPLTHTLIANYGGTIELTDTGDSGTVFTLTLPRASKPVPEHTDSNSCTSGTSSVQTTQ